MALAGSHGWIFDRSLEFNPRLRSLLNPVLPVEYGDGIQLEPAVPAWSQQTALLHDRFRLEWSGPVTLSQDSLCSVAANEKSSAGAGAAATADPPGFDTVADNTGTAGVLRVNGGVPGEIETIGDHDWFRVTLVEGNTYVIDLRGQWTGVGALHDPQVTLRDATGLLLAADDDSGHVFESELAFRAARTGTYFVDAGSLGNSGTGTYLLELEGFGRTSTRFQTPGFELFNFATQAHDWSSNDAFPRRIADMNGDGLDDIIGFGGNAVYVSFASNGGFGLVHWASGDFVPSGGWTSNDAMPREVGDVNGDGRADIVGFGATGVRIGLSNGGANTSGANFALAYQDLASFGSSAGGWTSNNTLPRTLADVNGDGRDDIVGFGGAGVYVSLAKTSGTPGFSTPFLALKSFGINPSAGGWANNDTYPRTLADVNGDGREDIIGFGATATYVALANANGTFGAPFVAIKSFGSWAAGGGWASFDDYPRLVQDINLDGRADIIGFGASYVYTALGNPNGTFGPAVTRDVAAFAHNASAGGWSSHDLYPRYLGDLSGDQRPEIIGFDADGVFVSRNFDFLTV